MTGRPSKLFYRIGEVCRICGIRSHVLRYWESEFPMLTPSRTKSGQRIFRPKDLSTVAAIKRLLHEEGYTIAGAVKYLRENGVGEQELPLFSHLSRGVREYRLAEIRQDLEGLLAILNRDPTREA